ncbi:cytochrome ubiquinol oxidase subunit I [Acuticoccus kandeliae]|uniref:cytochrome ubiquinol oxidase subunit I n=1 Tax=Acuticoccus kandeliae TaxID=2073160 RepID=UPI000D3E1D5C|nr:cytochrome ubiquinol oxidase subunit I [Acuticoccus kandeliae]
MELDPVLIARLQFAFTVTFHIIFPSFTIGLAAWITTLEGMWLKTKNDRYHELARFWTKVFAVSFGMGVVSGIVLSYQFGTNWSRYSEVVGNVIGPLIGYEVLTAFFLEATFLGLMLFGWNRVPPWLHFCACLAVAIGTTMSAFWILSANSWMQFPAGHEVRDGIAYPVDWLKIIFNPTFPTRLGHMVAAAYITTAFVVFATGARWLIAGIAPESAKTMVRMGLGLLIVLVPIQGFLGDASGENTLKYQPVKVAAMEAHWGGEGETTGPIPWVVFAWPNEAEERNDYQIAIPYLGSLILTRTLDGTIKGLKEFPEDLRPPVVIPFFTFRIMIGLWGLMMLTILAGGILWARGRLFGSTLYLKYARFLWPIGFLAILAGWYTTETGRQPWVATGILRTADAVSPVAGGAMATSLVLFILVYGIVFSAGTYYINRLLRYGPDVARGRGDEDVSGLRPLSGAKDAGRKVLEAGE